jgi:hypothetical protein
MFYTVKGIATASTPIDAGPVKAELLEISRWSKLFNGWHSPLSPSLHPSPKTRSANLLAPELCNS